MPSKSALFVIAAFLSIAPGLARATTTDVFGREVPVGEGRPALIFYSNDETRDALAKDAYALSFDVRDTEPIVIIRVDLRGVPSLFRGLALKEVRKVHDETVALMKRYYASRGASAPEGLVERSLYLVPDYSGGPHQARGLRQGFDTVIAEVRDGSGALVTTGRFPEDKARLARAIADEAPEGRLTRR